MTSRSEIDKHDKPVAWRSMEGSQYSLHHWAVDPYPESGPRIYRAAMAAARPPREPLYPASVVASLTAQRDKALARVVELEEEHQKLKDNAHIPKEVMVSDLARDEYNRIGHTEYMKKYRKEQ